MGSECENKINESSDEVPIKDEKRLRNQKSMKTIRIAVAGCSHGEMDTIYEALQEMERRNNYKIDLLICCGDFQAVRNYGDLSHMKINQKYRKLQNFHSYYTGEKEAPFCTIFVGGNHEASGYLQELPYGGWVAPNIYYMGHASCIQFAGLRIAGLSGIFCPQHYNLGHFERPPFKNFSHLVSVYHTRSVDVFRLKQLRVDDSSAKLDVFISHDWPAGITDYGNVQRLLRIKPFFKEDIDNMKLGSAPSMQLLHELRPRYWLSAHLHCQFAALVPHACIDESKKENDVTRFLALDKPLAGRHFLQILDFEVAIDAKLQLSYDPAWLAVLCSTDFLTSVDRKDNYMPSQGCTTGERWDFKPSSQEIKNIYDVFSNDLLIPENFRKTAPPHCRNQSMNVPPESYYRNPQTAEFCSKLGISDLNAMLCELSPNDLGIPFYLNEYGMDADDEEYKNLADYEVMLDTSLTDQ